MLPFRILAVAILIVSMVADTTHFKFVMYPDMQLVFGSIIVATIIFADVVVGFTLGLALFVLYIRVYAEYTGVELSWASLMNGRLTVPKTSYITPQNLKDAQSNVFDERSYTEEIKGPTGPNDSGIYGAQGLNATLPGYEHIPENNW